MDALKRRALLSTGYRRPCMRQDLKPRSTCTCTKSPRTPRRGSDSSCSSSSSYSIHRDDEANAIYGAMERTCQAQVELLHATADRKLHALAEGGGGDGMDDDEDDGMEGELGRLEEAERAMRDELEVAVSDFGSASSSPAEDVELAEQQVGDVTAAVVDTRELDAAMNDLCRWIREGDEHVRSHPRRPPPCGERRGCTEFSNEGNFGRDHAATFSRNGQIHSNLREIPLDDLCQWLRESDKYLNPRPEERSAHNKGDTLKLRQSDSDREHQSSVDNKLARAGEEETPHTFHLLHGRASSLLVLGAAGHHLVRAPKGRSPLR